MKRPNWEHGLSRYMCVSSRLIEKLQQNYFAGRDLRRSLADIDVGMAATIVAETLEADYFLTTLAERLKNGQAATGSPGDWTRATTAQFLYEVSNLAREQGDKNTVQTCWALSWAELEQIARSPTASPLLWYEDIFFDVGQELRTHGDKEAPWFLKRSLAHNLHYDEGSNASTILTDLAETYLWLNDLDHGLRIMTGLLRDDPSNVWVYNSMAVTFDRFGLAEIGQEAARRGLELVARTGDPEQMEDQLNDALDDLAQSNQRSQETRVDRQVLADLRAALTLDFDGGAHRPIAALCRELVPDLERIPLKQPPAPPDLPPPEEYVRLLQSQAERQPRQLTRNDPCWCGSGKKYKHCHLRTDQQGASRH